MKAHKPLRYVFCLIFLLPAMSSCDAQTNIQSGQSTGESPKLIKNYFITQYPQEFFFVQGGLQDEKGNMWFATGGNGIYVYDGTSFANFTHLDGLCHDDILCCMEDKAGNIWFGTRNGLIRYKPSGAKPTRNDFSNFLISDHVLNSTTGAKIPYKYKPADNFVWAIMQDRSGKIWFSTNKGIYLHNPLMNMENGMPLFTRFLDKDSLINKNDLKLNDVLSMRQDKRGNIWFTSGAMDGEGICYYDGRAVTNFKPDELKQFRAIIERKNGQLLFLNSFHGAYVYNPGSATIANDSFTNFTKQIGIKNDTLVSICEDKAGKLWFGVESDNMIKGTLGGVWCYDPSALLRHDTNPLKLFTAKDGLSHNCVFTIVEDNAGNMWFGTRNTGLCRYDGKTFTDFTD